MAANAEFRGRGPGLLASLCLLALLIHLPTMWKGFWQDDLVVLHRCASLSIPKLLGEGIVFHRGDIGNPWWIGPEIVARYFRPLLMLSFRLPMLLSRGACFQHGISLLLHLLLVLSLFFGLRRRLGPEGAGIAAACLAFSPHSWMPVQWIAARKELLVAAFFLWAFCAFRRSAWGESLLAVALAMATGEHGVMAPFLLLAWAWTRRDDDEEPAAPRWYGGAALALLLAYLALRHCVMGGMATPIAPYFNDPNSPVFLGYTLLKTGHWLLSMVTGLPYFDRVLLGFWLDRPLAGLACGCVVIALLVLLASMAGPRRRDFFRFGLLTALSHVPFLLMSACLFYPYSSQLFWAMACGSAWAGSREGAPVSMGRGRWGRRLLAAMLVLHALGLGALTWCVPEKDMTMPQRLWPRLERELGGRVARRVVLVNVPAYATMLAFLRSTETGSAPEDTLVLTARALPGEDEGVRCSFPAPGTLRVEARGRSWFRGALERWLLYLPDGLLSEGRVFERGWATIEILRCGDRPAPRDVSRHFFCSDGELKELELRWKSEEQAPLLVLFAGEAFRVVDPEQDRSDIEFPLAEN